MQLVVQVYLHIYVQETAVRGTPIIPAPELEYRGKVNYITTMRQSHTAEKNDFGIFGFLDLDFYQNVAGRSRD